MKTIVKPLPDTLAIFVICTMIVATPVTAASQVEAQRTPADSATSGTTDGGTQEAGDVKERGIRPLAPRPGMGALPPGTIAPPLPDATGFKCSPNSKQCRCSGATDCNYMKDLLRGSCADHTCTGSGATRKCCCVIGSGTCTP